MLYAILSILLLVVVVLKYWQPFGSRCPQCRIRREDADYPLCPDCGWIYDVPGEEDEDYQESAEKEDLRF